VVPLVESLNPAATVDCDVSDPASIDAAFGELGKVWDSMDFLVHAIAFSDKDQLKGRYLDTTPENFRMTMDISCYSFTAVAQRAEKLMTKGGAMVTLSYYGAERVMPHYNVMGVAKAALEASVRYMAEDLGKKAIRVNSISAGPIKTLAFAGIADSRYILKWNEYNSPLRRSVTQGEVGNSALFLLSDLGSAVTGENLHVDAGYHVVGMKAEDAPDINVVQKSDAP
jgi:enoyl-[acyl-carrier protein] reductase I